MESLTQIILALLGGGIVVKLFEWATSKLNRRVAETDLMGELAVKVKALVKQTIEDETEKASLRKQIEFKDDYAKELIATLKDVLIDHGEMKERERQCGERLDQLEAWRRSQEPLQARVTTLSDRVAEQAAELKHLQEKGIWTGDPKLTEAV